MGNGPILNGHDLNEIAYDRKGTKNVLPHLNEQKSQWWIKNIKVYRPSLGKC